VNLLYNPKTINYVLKQHSHSFKSTTFSWIQNDIKLLPGNCRKTKPVPVLHKINKG